jgi:hypothetical protein
MNKSVRFDDYHDLKVTGILKIIPANQHYSLILIVPFNYAVQNFSWVKGKNLSKH